MHKLLFSLVLLLAAYSAEASSLVVTTVNVTGPGSLDSAITNASPNDTITFDTILLSGGNAVIAGNLNFQINKPLTILGVEYNGHRVVLNGQGLNRIFVINVFGSDTQRHVRIINLDMINGSTPNTTDNQGGSIFIGGASSVVVSQCNISNSYAHRGGSVIFGFVNQGVFNSLDLVRLEDCEIFNNTSGQNSPGNGAVKTVGMGTLEIVDCVFRNNLNVCISNDNNSRLDVYRSVFRDNGDSATNERGTGVRVINVDHVHIDSCLFENNYSIFLSGGVSVWADSTLILSNSEFQRNFCGSPGSSGGGAFLRLDLPGKGRVEDCVFRQNHANTGGGITTYGVDVLRTTIRSNHASIGGGISSRSRTIINGCLIDSNVAVSSGGGVFSVSDDLFVIRTTLAHNSSGNNGGAISTSQFPIGTHVRIRQSTIAHNQAVNGGFSYLNRGIIQIQNSTIYGNHATSLANLIYHSSIDSMAVSSSIILNHGSALQAVQPISGSGSLPIISNGYNIYGPEISTNPHYTDIDNASLSDANLGVLSDAGNGVFCMIPQAGSKAANSGNRADFRPAQNDSIFNGIRDRGAAESQLLSNYEIDKFSVCDSLLFLGVYYPFSSTYTAQLTNRFGADSTIIYIVKVVPSFHQVDSVQSCLPYTWIDGNTYSSDTSSIINFYKEANCDSTYTLHFTLLNQSDSVTVSLSSCDSIIWAVDGNTYSTDTVTPWIALTSRFQCDSLVRLDFDKLEIPDTTFIDTVVCSSFPWIDGNVYFQDTIVRATLSAANGCDSIVQLDLQFERIFTFAAYINGAISVLPQQAQFQWIDCSSGLPISNAADTTHFIPDTNGTYAVVIDNGFCNDTSNCVTVADIGVKEQIANQLRLYPNPSPGKVYLSSSLSLTNIQAVEVLDARGRTISSQSSYEQDSGILLPKPHGLYLVRVRFENGENVVFRVIR
ncbi:MAG: T9SS type A sorting domain-containing protein [Flavobacteriia bacterium]|nr:T9SS type A sorting domain-containing protein [Flavobacteriia bacterium]